MSAPDLGRHPAWFGAVMGTGATAVVLISQSEAWDIGWLTGVAEAFLILATVLALILWPRYVGRMADREALREELRHAGHGAMLATFPAGLLVLAVGWGRIGPDLVPADLALGISAVLLVVGSVIAIAVGIAWAGAIARDDQELSAVNGGWLIPPVMNLLVPLAMVPLIVRFPQQAPWLLVVAFAFLGVGTVLFIAMLTLLVARLALRTSPAPQLAPSMWIPLAPAGILGLALLRLLQAGEAAGVDGFTSDTAGVVVAAMLVGFGAWWASFAAVDLIRVRRAGGVPFHPGWWGFVFPIAAMTLSITGIGQAVDATAVDVVGAIAAVALVLVWGLVAVRTVRLVAANRTR